jgi:hypothetical protein
MADENVPEAQQDIGKHLNLEKEVGALEIAQRRFEASLRHGRHPTQRRQWNVAAEYGGNLGDALGIIVQPFKPRVDDRADIRGNDDFVDLA